MSLGWNEVNLNWTFWQLVSKKRDFLQTTRNLDILYTVGKYFSSEVWIWDRYLKIRPRFSRIHPQSLSFLHKNVCRQSGHLRHKRRVPFWLGVKRNLLGPRNNNENGRRRRIDGVLPQLVHALPLWPMAASHIARSYPLLGWHPLSSFHRYRHTVELSVALIAGWPFVHERESEIEREWERERERERERCFGQGRKSDKGEGVGWGTTSFAREWKEKS